MQATTATCQELGVHQKSKPFWQVAVIACMPQSFQGVREETLALSTNLCSCGLESTTTHYHYHHYSLHHHHHYYYYYLLSTAITQSATTTTNTTTIANATSHITISITTIIIIISSIGISITTDTSATTIFSDYRPMNDVHLPGLPQCPCT